MSISIVKQNIVIFCSCYLFWVQPSILAVMFFCFFIFNYPIFYFFLRNSFQLSVENIFCYFALFRLFSVKCSHKSWQLKSRFSRIFQELRNELYFQQFFLEGVVPYLKLRLIVENVIGVNNVFHRVNDFVLVVCA